MAQLLNYDDLLSRLMKFDENIRFVTVCDMQGNQLATKIRDNTELYLSPADTKDTLQHAINAWKSRMKHYDKIGKGLYTLAVYENLRRVTVPLPSGNLLLATIGNQGGLHQIIDKILNEVRYHDYTKS